MRPKRSGPLTARAERSALVVDDDPDMRHLMSTVLEMDGDLECDEAADALHALELWQLKHHDIVVTDQRMPGPSGIDLAATLLEQDPSQLVLLFSAYVEPNLAERAEQLGIYAVLAKDEIRRLPDVVREALTS